MDEDSVVPLPRPGTSGGADPLLVVLREGARRMLTQAIEAEVEAFLHGDGIIVEVELRSHRTRLPPYAFESGSRGSQPMSLKPRSM